MFDSVPVWVDQLQYYYNIQRCALQFVRVAVSLPIHGHDPVLQLN